MESTTKPKRPAFQPYIPVHRRNKTPVTETAISTPPPRPTLKDEPEVKRRGRGQFRAPTSDDIVTMNSPEPKNPNIVNTFYKI